MNFNTIYNELLDNKKNHNSGYYNCIPFMGMDRLESFIPGIEQGTYYILTAGSGIGKSKLCRFLFIHNPYQYIVNNPDKDIELSIKYFSLEESRKKVILSEISKYLFTKYNLIVSIKDLQSIGKYNTIDEDTLIKVKEAEEYINNFLKYVDIIDSLRNPTGIYKYVRDFALTIGTYYDTNNKPLSQKEIENIKNGVGEDFKKVAYYKKYNPKHYVIIIIDHISLIEQEFSNGVLLTQHQSMSKLSSKYNLHFRDKFGFTPVIVQQQSSDKERIESNYKGETLQDKLLPSLDGLGDNKTLQRDADIILGLFAPDRYNIKMYGGYDIGILEDRFRLLSILKDRNGVANKKLPLFFNGATDFFKELPKSDDLEGIEKVYEYIKKIKK